ncbi:MAG: phosphate-starvation-inducible PsiE family protein [Crocosphaera sp.]
MYESFKNTSSQRKSWVNLNGIVNILEIIQDAIVICLCLGLFCFMVLQLYSMVVSLLPPLQFHVVTADILSLLIWVELFRLLIIYLKEQRISIGVAVEVAIVSVLREFIVRGVLEIPATQVLATCAFLLVLGLLMVIRVWLPPTFDGIDPEEKVSQRHQQRSTVKKAEMNGNHAILSNN